jgi:hypothetical protein
MEIAMSKFMNGNKKADVIKTDNGYAVNMYLDDKFFQKRNVFNIDDAEALAEDFVLEEGDSGPKFLNENV